MTFTFDNELTAQVKEVIEEQEQFEELRGLHLCVLFSGKEKKKNGMDVYADTKKVNDLYRFITGYDFIITFYAKSEYLSEKAMKILIEHELMHIGVERRGLSVRTYIKPHDVQEFRAIITKYGVEWTTV